MKHDDYVVLVQYRTEQRFEITLTPNETETLTFKNIAAFADASLWQMALSNDASEEFQDRSRVESRNLPMDARGRRQVGK